MKLVTYLIAYCILCQNLNAVIRVPAGGTVGANGGVGAIASSGGLVGGILGLGNPIFIAGGASLGAALISALDSNSSIGAAAGVLGDIATGAGVG